MDWSGFSLVDWNEEMIAIGDWPIEERLRLIAARLDMDEVGQDVGHVVQDDLLPAWARYCSLRDCSTMDCGV